MFEIYSANAILHRIVDEHQYVCELVYEEVKFIIQSVRGIGNRKCKSCREEKWLK